MSSITANGYCTPAEVCRLLQMKDTVTGSAFVPTDDTDPSLDDIQEQINIFSESFDASVRDTWRTKRRSAIYDRGTEWARNNASSYFDVPYYTGGWATQLLSPVIPIDAEQGDKVEIMSSTPGVYIDITDSQGLYWIDYEAGIFYYLGADPRIHNLFRITYRYGRNEDVPLDVKGAVARMTAIWLMDSDWYRTKIGGGGDLQSKNETKRDWEKYIDRTILNNMNSGDVISLLP